MNYFSLIEDLLRAGVSQGAIADATGMDQSTISRIWRGERKPRALRYDCMVKLIELHRKMKRRIKK